MGENNYSNKPVKLATLEAYVSGNTRDINDLKARDLDMVLVHIKRVPVILVRADTKEKEAIVQAALDGVIQEESKRRDYPSARK